MQNLEADQQHIINGSLKMIKKCPVCNTPYTVNQITIIEQNNEKANAQLHFSCRSCHSGLLAQIIELPFGFVGSAMMTDLEKDEVFKFKQSEQVTIDDLLDFHQKLNKNN